MIHIPRKRKAIYPLFFSALLLLIFNLIHDKFFSEKIGNEPSSFLYSNEVNEKFLNSVKSFGISDDWIVENKSRGAVYFYIISLPADLPIPVVLADIFSTFNEDSLNITSIEKVRGGQTEFKITSGDETLIKANFRYSRNLIREGGKVGILVEDFFLEDKSDSMLYKFPEPFCVVMIP
jgi:hypothetical protein